MKSSKIEEQLKRTEARLQKTKEEKKALKQAALDNDMSASELVRKWIAEYWEKQEAKR